MAAQPRIELRIRSDQPAALTPVDEVCTDIDRLLGTQKAATFGVSGGAVLEPGKTQPPPVRHINDDERALRVGKDPGSV